MDDATLLVAQRWQLVHVILAGGVLIGLSVWAWHSILSPLSVRLSVALTPAAFMILVVGGCILVLILLDQAGLAFIVGLVLAPLGLLYGGLLGWQRVIERAKRSQPAMHMLGVAILAATVVGGASIALSFASFTGLIANYDVVTALALVLDVIVVFEGMWVIKLLARTA